MHATAIKTYRWIPRPYSVTVDAWRRTGSSLQCWGREVRRGRVMQVHPHLVAEGDAHAAPTLRIGKGTPLE